MDHNSSSVLRLSCSSSETSISSLENSFTGGKRSWRRSAAYKAPPHHLQRRLRKLEVCRGHETVKPTFLKVSYRGTAGDPRLTMVRSTRRLGYACYTEHSIF